jgi:hypothetical protein
MTALRFAPKPIESRSETKQSLGNLALWSHFS